jgi:hypothetical protein
LVYLKDLIIMLSVEECENMITKKRSTLCSEPPHTPLEKKGGFVFVGPVTMVGVGEIPLILLTLSTVVRWRQGNVARACLNMPNFNVRDTKMLLVGLVEYSLFFCGLGCDCATSTNFLTRSRTGLRLLLK